MSGMSGDLQTVSPNLAGAVAAAGTTYSKTDISGTPGNGTVNTPLGRCAIAALASSVVITSSLVSATSRVSIAINGAAADATLTVVPRYTVAANTLTTFGNAAATGNVVVDFVIYP